MKRYLLFAGAYASEYISAPLGWEAYMGEADSVEDAKGLMARFYGDYGRVKTDYLEVRDPKTGDKELLDWWQIVDTETKEVVAEGEGGDL